MYKLTFVLILSFLTSSAYNQPNLPSNFYEMRREILQKSHDFDPVKFDYLRRPAILNQSQFDITAYFLNLSIWPDVQLIEGSTVIEGNSQVDQLSHLTINLFGNMVVDSIKQGANILSFSRSENLIELDLMQSLGNGERFSIEVFYGGYPQNVGLGAWRWGSHQGIPIVSTLSEPFGAPAWWPCKDDPADKADSVFLNIEVPQDLIVASNGILTSISPLANGRHTFHWETHYPISQYLVSLAITNYAFFNDWYVSAAGDSMPLQYYVYPEHLVAAQQDFAITKDMITAFAPIFGEYPFLAEKYGMAIFTWGGAMEHQTMTSYGQNLITGNNTYDWINAHELAHQWFGDLITMKRWSHIWLNEGFASYAEALWREAAYGHAAYQSYLRSQDPGYFSGSLFVQDSTNVSALFRNTVYDKGSWTLHMLRGVLGDSLFFAALKQYATNPALMYGNAITEDFQQICETVSGRNLGWFFQQWVYRPGRPDYKFDWSYSEATDGFLTNLTIWQNNATPYKMPLEVLVSGNGLERQFILWDSLPAQSFDLPTTFQPELLVIDPDNWVLKYLERVTWLSEDFPEVFRAFEVLPNYPNPFNGQTTIRFYLPVGGAVELRLYNLLGQLIYDKEKRMFSAGYNEFYWAGIDNSGEEIASGIYLLQVSDGRAVQTRKIVLLR